MFTFIPFHSLMFGVDGTFQLFEALFLKEQIEEQQKRKQMEKADKKNLGIESYSTSKASEDFRGMPYLVESIT